jgi:endogenous inhibitor of DNA gyrase (YacG/DUF329 family)
MKKEIKVKCPQCSKEFNYYDSEFRPFCCTKCQQIDLGHWFKESYTVPVKESERIESGEKESTESQNEVERDDENNESEYH